MWAFLLRLLGHRAVHQAAAKHTQNGRPLDIRFGLSLFREKRVPIGAKLLTLGLSAGIVAGLIALEVPLEGALAVLLPIFVIPEGMFDGLEAIVGPLVLSGLLLPLLTPKHLLAAIRGERMGTIPETVIEAEFKEPEKAAPQVLELSSLR